MSVIDATRKDPLLFHMLIIFRYNEGIAWLFKWKEFSIKNDIANCDIFCDFLIGVLKVKHISNGCNIVLVLTTQLYLASKLL